MTPEQFAYWLQGFVELSGQHPTEAQWNGIKAHLQTVFNKVTPPARVSNIGMALHKMEEGIANRSQNITSLSC